MEVLCSPVNGKATMLENVHDEMFSEKMLGDGIAVIPDENELRSPVEGTVTMIYETQHAIGIQTDLGTDIRHRAAARGTVSNKSKGWRSG